jgi:predicted GIY-YIG superfamily endonuclease
LSVQNEALQALTPVATRPTDPPHPGAAAVYRFYDADGALLYIGSTSRPGARWYRHKTTKEWWANVAAYSLAWRPDRADAFAEEYRAIRAEAPVHNTMGVFPFGEPQPIGVEAQRVIDALDALEEIEDPRVRTVAFSHVSAEQARRAPAFREQRRQLIAEYRAQGASYRKIATVLGISLATVQDIERGYTGSGKNRPRASEERPPGAAGTAGCRGGGVRGWRTPARPGSVQTRRAWRGSRWTRPYRPR